MRYGMSVENDEKEKGKIQKLIGIIVSIVTAIALIFNAAVGYGNYSLNKKKSEQDQKYREWQQDIEVRKELPNIKVEERKTISFYGVRYKGYKLYDSNNNIEGEFLDNLNGVIVVKSGETIIKVLLIKDSVKKEELPLETKLGIMTFLVREPEEIELKIENIQREIKLYLQSDGVENCEYSVQFGVLTTIKYTGKSNVRDEGRYIIFIDENVRCEVIENEYEKCDRYFLEYGKTEQGNEFEEMIQEAGERIEERNELK